MWKRGLSATVLGLSCLLVATAALGQTAGPQGIPGEAVSQQTVPVRVRHFEGTVSVQRALAGETAEALVNLPLEPGDRLWTDRDGRAELVLPDGTVLWVDQHTTIDIVTLGEDGDGAILRLWGGNLILRRPIPVSGSIPQLRIDTASASTSFDYAGLFRVDLDADHRVWLSVFQGKASMAAGGLTEIVGAGDRTFAEADTAPAELISFNTAEQDDFAAWHSDRLAELVATERHVRERDYLPAAVAANAAELETSGAWFYHADFDAWAWRPTVGVSIDWSPYRNGRWVYGYGGWSWVSYASWGWTTTHYGRWHHLPAHGWVWFPGRSYSPAWVSWYVGGSYIGWCPIGYYNRPFISVNLWFGGGYGYGRGYHGRHNYDYNGYTAGRGVAVAGRGYTRGRAVAGRGWSFAPDGQLGGGAKPMVSRTAVVRTSSGNSVAFNGTLRSRNPRTLVAANLAAVSRRTTAVGDARGDRGPRVGTPRSTVSVSPSSGGSRGAIARPRPDRASVRRTDPSPGRPRARASGRTQAVTSERPRAQPRPVKVEVRPRSQSRPYRAAIIRPRSGAVPGRVAPRVRPAVPPRTVQDGPGTSGTTPPRSGPAVRTTSRPRVSVPRSSGGSRGSRISKPSRSSGRSPVGRPRSGTSSKGRSARSAKPRGHKNS